MSVNVIEPVYGRETLGPSDVETGRRLRALRLDRDVSQIAIAEAMGITYQQFQKYETGENRLSLTRLRQVCAYFDVSLSYFVDDALPETDEYFISLSQDHDTIGLVKAFSTIAKRSDRKLVLALARSLADKPE